MALNKKYDWKLLLVFMTLFLSVYLDSESAQLKEETKGYKTDSINNIKYSNSKTITQDTNDTDHNIKLIVLFSLIPFTLVFSFGVFIWYRLKRENEFRTKEANFKHQIIEVEMKALRAQINPHFIFNCMNSVNNFMQQNNVSEASIYLVKFSNLIRQILENSEHFEISLKKDLETLQLYIQMEQLRLPAGFKYQIKIDEIIDLEATRIPPMLLQPFVENCIWHGLNSKGSKGMIKINITLENNLLKFCIEDNGSEITLNDHPAIYKKKSMGMSLTNERIEVFNKLKNSNAHFKISDIRNESNEYTGKRIELWMPYN